MTSSCSEDLEQCTARSHAGQSIILSWHTQTINTRDVYCSFSWNFQLPTSVLVSNGILPVHCSTIASRELVCSVLCVWGQLIKGVWDCCGAKKIARARHLTVDRYKKCCFLYRSMPNFWNFRDFGGKPAIPKCAKNQFVSTKLANKRAMKLGGLISRLFVQRSPTSLILASAP